MKYCIKVVVHVIGTYNRLLYDFIDLSEGQKKLLGEREEWRTL